MVNSVIDIKKKKMRERIKALLHIQKEGDRLKKSRLIQKKLFSLTEFKKAKNVMFFASFGGEVETFSMMEEAAKLGKRIVLPLIEHKTRQIIPSRVLSLRRELDTGPYGIKQPRYNKRRHLSPGGVDLVVVPGIAFDKKGNRLGRGAGYYDRFLQQLSEDTPTVGLAFNFQITRNLPYAKDRDIPVDKVVSA